MPTIVKPKKTSERLPGYIPSAVRSLANVVWPADQVPLPGVSIGPKAVPLADEDRYLKQLLTDIAPDLAKKFGRHYLAADPARTSALTPHLRKIIVQGLADMFASDYFFRH